MVLNVALGMLTTLFVPELSWHPDSVGTCTCQLVLWCPCCIQVSYGIGLPHPLSVYVDTFKTGRLPDEEILEAVKEKFDFRPGMIMQVSGHALLTSLYL
jgi:hypothetical protein